MLSLPTRNEENFVKKVDPLLLRKSNLISKLACWLRRLIFSFPSQNSWLRSPNPFLHSVQFRLKFILPLILRCNTSQPIKCIEKFIQYVETRKNIFEREYKNIIGKIQRNIRRRDCERQNR